MKSSSAKRTERENRDFIGEFTGNIQYLCDQMDSLRTKVGNKDLSEIMDKQVLNQFIIRIDALTTNDYFFFMFQNNGVKYLISSWAKLRFI